MLTLPAQDYENPTDTDSDRVYEATLTATDTDSNTVTASVTVTVTDVDTEDDPNDWTRFSGTCVANDTTLCLQNNRFEARVVWKTDVNDAPSWGSVEVSRGASGVFSLRQIWRLVAVAQRAGRLPRQWRCLGDRVRHAVAAECFGLRHQRPLQG